MLEIIYDILTSLITGILAGWIILRGLHEYDMVSIQRKRARKYMILIYNRLNNREKILESQAEEMMDLTRELRISAVILHKEKNKAAGYAMKHICNILETAINDDNMNSDELGEALVLQQRIEPSLLTILRISTNDVVHIVVIYLFIILCKIL